MSEAKFTPGPWETFPHHPAVYAKGYGSICILSTRSGFQKGTAPRSKEQAVADAHIIAAAPDMYDALERLMSELPTRRDWLDPVTEQMAKAALAKARGEAQ